MSKVRADINWVDEGDTVLSVAQLIELLQTVPGEAYVILEGCDCQNEAYGLLFDEGRVLIVHSKSWYLDKRPIRSPFVGEK